MQAWQQYWEMQNSFANKPLQSKCSQAAATQKDYLISLLVYIKNVAVAKIWA